MKTTYNFNKHLEHADGINRVHNFINEVAPKLINELNKGFKQKDDGSLYKKDKERLYAYLDDVSPIRAYISCAEYSIYLKVDVSYQDSPAGSNDICTYSYYHKQYLLWRKSEGVETFQPLPLVTALEIEDAHKEIKRLEDLVRNSGYEISKLKHKLGY